ncbi:PREDICTED: trichohyalin-like [Branchiostoma belcheri]|uniref:Trichohyalin-like n=1 Tax=Branchiostoma belcheri TaxID=7741 RepID=A0A6P4Z331_BRABE|nr:PREDICTED: trichohyalin-like [Branchiostoma belcheri]
MTQTQVFPNSRVPTLKAQLAAFRRRKAAKDEDTKKKKKRKKREEAGAAGGGQLSSPDPDSQSKSLDISTASNSSLDLTYHSSESLSAYDSDQQSTSAEELSEEGEDSVALDVARVELKQAKAQIHALEEKLYGKQAALEALTQDCERLKAQGQHQGDTQGAQSGIEKTVEATVHKTSVAEYKEKLQEFQQAITQRDDIINQLSVNLQVTVQERDSVQQEAGLQVAQLTQQIQTLQLQLQQAGEMLKSQTGQQGTSVEDLFATQQQVITLQQKIQEQERLLQERDSLLQQGDSAMREKTDLLEQKEAALSALAQKAARQSEELQNLREGITSAETVKQQMDLLKQQSSEEIRTLMQTVEELQKRLHDSAGRERGEGNVQALESQRAELEELHGQQIQEMKESIKEQYQILTEKLQLENQTLRQQQQEEMEALRLELASAAARRDEVEQQWSEQNELVQSLTQEVSRLTAATEDSAAYLNVVTELKREYDSKIQQLDDLVKSSAAENEQLRRKEEESKLKITELSQQLQTVSEENVQLRTQKEETVAVQKKPETDLRLEDELQKIRGQLKDVRDELEEAQFDKESLQQSHHAELTRLRSELIYEHENKMKVFKDNLEATFQHKVESIKAKKDREFVEQLQQARAEMEETHKRELEEQRKQYSIESLHFTEEEAPEVSELLSSLQQENRDLSEARDALLEQIDQSHHDLEEMQEELLKVANAKDKIIAENESLKQQVRDSVGQNTSQRILNLERELQEQRQTFSFAERNYQVNMEEMQAECTQLLEAKQVLEERVNELLAAKVSSAAGEFGPSGDVPSTTTDSTAQTNSELVQELQDLKDKLKEQEELLSQLESLKQALDVERQNKVILEEKAMNQMNSFELEKKTLQDQIVNLQQLAAESDQALQVTRQNESDSDFDRIFKENQELRKTIQTEQEERGNADALLSTLTETLESVKNELKLRESEQLELREAVNQAMADKEESLASKDAELQNLKRDIEILRTASNGQEDKSTDDEFQTLGQPPSESLLQELEQVKKELKETQEIYSKENKLLKEALEYERKGSPLLEQEEQGQLQEEPGQLHSRMVQLQEEQEQLQRRVVQLQEEVSRREDREQELIQEKNQLVAVLKERTAQLQQDKETVQQQLQQQEDLVQTFQTRMQTSDSVSAEVQQVFGRQLSALQAQRDELLRQLETHRQQQTSFSDILLEKNALEENLQKEKELLRTKLQEKDDLERGLQEERKRLEQQVQEQRRLEAVLEEKNKLEQELAKQKRELEGQLREIEERLHEKEVQLAEEKELLARETRIKEVEMRRWQADLKEKQLEFRDREAQLRTHFSTQIQKVQSSTEETNIKRIQLMRVEMEGRHKDAIQRLRRELDQDYSVREKRLRDGHSAAVSILKKQHQQQVWTSS